MVESKRALHAEAKPVRSQSRRDTKVKLLAILLVLTLVATVAVTLFTSVK